MPTPARREISAIDASAFRISERGAGGREYLLAVALGVGPPSRRRDLTGGHGLQVDMLSGYPLE